MSEAVRMNFDEAIVAHAEWKLKLTLYLQGEGKLDHAIVCRDDQCKLGQWIYSDGKKYANELSYENLKKVHAEFHLCAGHVIKTIDDRKIDEAKKLIGGESNYAKASATVIEAISAVKRRVEEKTNMIMQNVKVGVLIINRNLEVQSGYSHHCHELFDAEQVAGSNICELLLLDKRSRSHFESIFEQAFDDFIPPEVSLSMLPSRLARGEKVLELHSSVIRSGGKEIDFVLFTVSDATKLEALEAEKAENAALLKILRNRDSFVGFLKDARASLDEMLKASENDQVKIRRIVHTIKGNAGMFDMTQLMQHIGRIEDGETILGSDIESIRHMLSEFVLKYKDFIGVELDRGSDEVHSIAESELSLLESKLQNTRDLAKAQNLVFELTSRLRMRTARSVIGPVEERVEAVAQRLHKAVRCRVEGDDTLVNPNRVGPIIQVLSHILRNSVDHGIEAAAERVDSGKSEEGSLIISFEEQTAGALKIVVQDDGRGIKTDKLVEKALKSGVITPDIAAKMSEQDKIDLIFLDGVSTADEVTDISGRGVGMSALKAKVAALGGYIHVTSQYGLGTSIEISIPAVPRVELAMQVA